VANTFLEPVIYGRATGVSSLGLLVAALFWTWLWGALGLVLSTPLTVCLAALGKSVPGLRVFAILLGEEPPLAPNVRFYQRLLARDQDGAAAIVEASLEHEPREAVFDQVVIPAMALAERDRAADELDDREQAFVERVVSDLIDDLAETPATHPTGPVPAETDQGAGLENEHRAAALRVLGIAASDQAEMLVLRMLAQLLPPHACKLTILAAPESYLKLAETVAEADPELVIVSHLPPTGTTRARYLVRRLRARFADLPIVVGLWTGGDDAEVAERLASAGATRVATHLAEVRELILKPVQARPPEPAGSPPDSGGRQAAARPGRGAPVALAKA
jgi:hypothetical protein